METLYWATRESDVASLIFVTSVLVFVASIVFTIVARCGSIRTLLDIAFWATAIGAIGAILAMSHLARKTYILCGLWVVLAQKTKSAPSMAHRKNIRKVRAVTFTQILLTLTGFVSASASAVALAWSAAENGYSETIATPEKGPFWLALGAVAAAVGSTIVFFAVEYVVRYNLSPKLGEFVCESFRDEIEAMCNVLSVPENNTDTKQVQERETWEYTAREFLHRYRFDTVFAADRFGSILQYIQSGMERRT